jgi:hypothetical protein
MAWVLGRSSDVIEPCEEVARTMRLLPQDERSYFLHFFAASLRIGAFHDLGRYGRFLEELGPVTREAQATENHTALLQLALTQTIAEDYRGNPGASVPRLEAQRRILPLGRFGLFRAVHMISVARAACATGQYEWGLRHLRQDWPLFLRSPMERAAYMALLAHSSRINLLLSASFAGVVPINVEAEVGSELAALGKLPLPAGAKPRSRVTHSVN